MTMHLYKPFARKLQRNKSRKRPLPPSSTASSPASSSSKASAGSSLGDVGVSNVGKNQRSGSGGAGEGSVITALTALSGEGGSAVTAFSSSGCPNGGGSAGDSLGTHESQAHHQEGHLRSTETRQQGASTTRRRRADEEAPQRPRSVVAGKSTRQQGARRSRPRQAGKGDAVSSSTDDSSTTNPRRPPPSDKKSPLHQDVIPGPQTLEVEGEEAVPFLYDFWECNVLPHRQSSFARMSYHDGAVDAVRGKKTGSMKKGVSKASVTSFATTVEISNTASDRRRAAFQNDGGGGKNGSEQQHGKNNIGLLMYDSGGWTSYPTSSHTSSRASSHCSANLASGGAPERESAIRSGSNSSDRSGARRPSLSDPYPYWKWPTRSSTTFSSPWTAEEEEYWGKTGGMGVRAALGLPKGGGHARTSSLESFSGSSSTGSGSKGGKMDSHFPHGALPSSVAYPLQSVSQQPHQKGPDRAQQAPPSQQSPSRRPASAAMLAQRKMMERRQAQRRKKAARGQHPPPVAGRGGAGRGYATPASSTRDLLWNIPEGQPAAPSSAAPRRQSAAASDGSRTRRSRDPGMQPVIPVTTDGRSAPVSSAIASVIEEERDRAGSLNTPPLEGLSSEERDSSTEGDNVEVPDNSERRNRPDVDQPNDPGEHGALYEEQLHDQEQMPAEMQMPIMDMPGMEGVPTEAMGAQHNNDYAIDAPPQMEGYGNTPPHQQHQHPIEGRGEGDPRNLVDPAVFRSVLRSKLAHSAGVFDWNAPSGFRPVVDEICWDDDATDISGDLTIPLAIMEEEDWERERRRRGFPGQIALAPAAATADDSGRISVLTGAVGDDVSALGEPAVEPAPVFITTPRGEGQWEVRGDGTRPATAPGGVRDVSAVRDKDAVEEIIVGNHRDEEPTSSGGFAHGTAAENNEPAVVFVGRVQQQDREASSVVSSEAERDATEMTRDFTQEFADELFAAVAKRKAAAAVIVPEPASQSSIEYSEIVTATPAPVVTPPVSAPSSPRSRSASELSEEERSAAAAAGLGFVDAALAKDEGKKQRPSMRRVPSNRDRPWLSAAPSASFECADDVDGIRDGTSYDETSHQEKVEAEDDHQSIELSVGFPNQDNASRGAEIREEEDDGDDDTLELAAAAVASASAAFAAATTVDVPPAASEDDAPTSSVKDEEEQREVREDAGGPLPAGDADVARLLGMVTHSPTASSASSESQKRSFVEGAEDDFGDDTVENEDSSENDDGWQTDHEDCTTLQDEESTLSSFRERGDRPATHEELHGGDVFAAFAAGELSLGSASSLNSTSCDERSDAEEHDNEVNVLETVDELGAEREENEANEEEESIAASSAASEEPPSPVQGSRPWSQYMAPATAASASASHSSASTSNQTPPRSLHSPSLHPSLSPPRLGAGSDADSASLSSGVSSGLVSQASSRSRLSGASSTRIMAALGGIVDSESDDDDSLVFEDAPIYEEEEEDDDDARVDYEEVGAEERQGDSDFSAAAAPYSSSGPIALGEGFGSLAVDVEEDEESVASSTLVDHIGEMLDGAAEAAVPECAVFEEEAEKKEEARVNMGKDDAAKPSQEPSPSDPAEASSASPEQEESSESPPSYFGGSSSSSPISSLTAAHEAGRFQAKPSKSSSSSSRNKTVKWIDFGFEASVLPGPAPSTPRHKRGGSVLSAGGSSCGGYSGFTAATESITRGTASEDERSHDRAYASLSVPDSPSASIKSASSSRSSRAAQERKIRESMRGLEVSLSEDEGEPCFDDQHSLNSSFNSSVASSVFSESEGSMVNDMIGKLKEEAARRRARLTRRRDGGKKAAQARPALDRMGSF